LRIIVTFSVHSIHGGGLVSDPQLTEIHQEKRHLVMRH
jgi:hypothetical protein